MATSRRDFLRRLTTGVSTALAAAARAGAPAPRPLVGSQLYGWGQYYQRAGKNLNEHLDEVLSALREAGYDFAEGFLDVDRPEANGRFAERLRANGLQPVTLYTGGRLHDEKAGEVVQRLLRAAQAAREAGFRILNCNPDPIGRAKTEAELERQAAALTELGQGLNALGLKLGIHHHTPELAEQAREFHFNFRHTPAEVVGFNIDVHWMYRGGLPPLEALRAYGERVVSWHLRQSRNGVWWEDLDTGDIDYVEIARFARERQLAPVYAVELALEEGTRVTRSVEENHRRSREFVRQVFGC